MYSLNYQLRKKYIMVSKVKKCSCCTYWSRVRTKVKFLYLLLKTFCIMRKLA